MSSPDRPSDGTGRVAVAEHARFMAAVAYAFAIAMCGTTLPTPLYGLYQERIGFSSFMVTVIFAVYAAGVITTLLLFGRLSDLRGRRPVLLAGLALSAASALCFLFEDGLPYLFVGRVLSGFSAGLFTGTATVAVSELAPPRWRATAPLVATFANMGGLGSGPLLAGLLAEYGPQPLRLVFLVDLALVATAGVAVALVPETVRVGHAQAKAKAPRRRGLHVPREMRPTFLPAASAGFAGFAVLGLFTSVEPTFLREAVGVHNLAIAGAVVAAVFAASTVGQLAMGRVGAGNSLKGGCVVMTVGLVAIICALVAASLALLLVGAVIAGAGQGLSFRAAVTEVARRSPADQAAEITSALFVVLYVAISVPVMGVGALSLAIGIRDASLVLSGCVALLAAATAARLMLVPRPGTS